LVFSPEKAAVEKVERAAKSCRGEKKNGNRGMTGFFKTLDSNFFILRPWNPDLFIEGERGIFYL
jgi:hypothetical protein